MVKFYETGFQDWNFIARWKNEIYFIVKELEKPFRFCFAIQTTLAFKHVLISLISSAL